MIIKKFAFSSEVNSMMEDLEMGTVYQPIAGSNYVKRAIIGLNPNGRYLMFYNQTEVFDPGENNALPYVLPFILT